MTHHLGDGVLVGCLLLRHVLEAYVEEADEGVEEAFSDFDFLLVGFGDEVDDFADGATTRAVVVLFFKFSHNLIVFKVIREQF